MDYELARIKKATTIKELMDDVFDEVVKKFNAAQLPVRLRLLSQRYSKKASGFGFDLTKAIEIDSRFGILVGYQGARFVYPKDVLFSSITNVDERIAVMQTWMESGSR